jgi:UDP-glucose 4-epimerase
MSILITGINGFIGQRLSEFLEERNKGTVFGYSHTKGIDKRNTRARSSDVTRLDSFKNYQGNKIDIIIHLAAKTSIEDSIMNPYDTYFTNITGTLNLLEYARTNGIKNFIFISTYLYGNPLYLPIDENHPLMPHTPYNKSKFLGEKLCEYYSSEYELNVVTLRPFNIYGPNNKESSLIQRIINAVNNDEVLVLNGSKSRRDFLYIDDFVDLIAKVLTNFPPKYNVYNVGYGVSHSLRDVARNVAQLMNKVIKIQSRKQKPTDIVNISADISKVSRKFDWNPKIDLDLGLKLVVQNLQK